MKELPHQTRTREKVLAAIDAQPDVACCVTAPTGAGKTFTASNIMREHGGRVLLLTHRKLLLEQLANRFRQDGHDLGIIAAGHEYGTHHSYLAMVQTLQSRFLKKEIGLPEFDLLMIDEAHVIKNGAAAEIIQTAKLRGKPLVGFTATPVDLGQSYDVLMRGGTLEELRSCRMLLPAVHFAPDEPDVAKIKRQATGEFVYKDVKRRIMTQTIVGRVIEHFRTLNPEQKPTIGFACGVAESRWLAVECTKAGIPSAHIDATEIWVHGESIEPTPENREFVLDMVRHGEIKIIWNRFVLREGIDLPELAHCILCTPFGKLSSYLQAAGRVLRAFPGMDHVTIQDHGGNWHLHGSVNADRDWYLDRTDRQMSALREDRLRERKEPEPICCPQCHSLRLSGSVCHNCGHTHAKNMRQVVQADGSLKSVEGKIYKPRRKYERSDAANVWRRYYHRAKRARMTFRQAEALFAMENQWRYPSRDLPLMPKDEFTFSRKVNVVEPSELI